MKSCYENEKPMMEKRLKNDSNPLTSEKDVHVGDYLIMYDYEQPKC